MTNTIEKNIDKFLWNNTYNQVTNKLKNIIDSKPPQYILEQAEKNLVIIKGLKKLGTSVKAALESNRFAAEARIFCFHTHHLVLNISNFVAHVEKYLAAEHPDSTMDRIIISAFDPVTNGRYDAMTAALSLFLRKMDDISSQLQARNDGIIFEINSDIDVNDLR